MDVYFCTSVCVCVCVWFCVVLSCVGRGLLDGLITRQRVLRRAIIRLRNVRCNAAKVLTRNVEQWMMIMRIFTKDIDIVMQYVLFSVHRYYLRVTSKDDL
jgi:hypothetical protein